MKTLYTSCGYLLLLFFSIYSGSSVGATDARIFEISTLQTRLLIMRNDELTFDLERDQIQSKIESKLKDSGLSVVAAREDVCRFLIRRHNVEPSDFDSVFSGCVSETPSLDFTVSQAEINSVYAISVNVALNEMVAVERKAKFTDDGVKVEVFDYANTWSDGAVLLCLEKACGEEINNAIDLLLKLFLKKLNLINKE